MNNTVLAVVDSNNIVNHFPDSHAILNDEQGALLVLHTTTKRCHAAYANGEWKRFYMVEDQKSQPKTR